MDYYYYIGPAVKVRNEQGDRITPTVEAVNQALVKIYHPERDRTLPLGHPLSSPRSTRLALYVNRYDAITQLNRISASENLAQPLLFTVSIKNKKVKQQIEKEQKTYSGKKARPTLYTVELEDVQFLSASLSYIDQAYSRIYSFNPKNPIPQETPPQNRYGLLLAYFAFALTLTVFLSALFTYFPTPPFLQSVPQWPLLTQYPILGIALGCLSFGLFPALWIGGKQVFKLAKEGYQRRYRKELYLDDVPLTTDDLGEEAIFEGVYSPQHPPLVIRAPVNNYDGLTAAVSPAPQPGQSPLRPR